MECNAELNSDAALAAPAVDTPVLKPWIIFLFSLTCALAVANVYSAQPLLESISLSLQVPAGMIGSVVTVTQVGYAAGLIFLVPLGDRVKRKTLVVTLLLLSMLALIVAGLSPNFVTLLCAVLFIGLMAVVVQLVVAWAAILAAPQRRGKVVGTVTSGIVLGILLARFISGSIADIAGWRAVYLTATGAALALLTLSWLPIAYTETSLAWLVVGIIMLDFAVQTVHVISQSTLITARPEAASRLVGAYMCFYSIGSATGAIVATQLYACFGWQAVCLAGASVSACAFLIWLGLAKL